MAFRHKIVYGYISNTCTDALLCIFLKIYTYTRTKKQSAGFFSSVNALQSKIPATSAHIQYKATHPYCWNYSLWLPLPPLIRNEDTQDKSVRCLRQLGVRNYRVQVVAWRRGWREFGGFYTGRWEVGR